MEGKRAADEQALPVAVRRVELEPTPAQLPVALRLQPAIGGAVSPL
ncbi:hypothetical protein PC129_g16199 [Phytophthora cactorum]|uniref:Uncharacterized protein n=1 Tax=Phytophthora cactorum TaxID=29920 RepID=A0A329RNF9_9STRA|nr:hypothetical protein Pcac1_g1034 [Phytophthora cactorum]KAG2794127.1 hypothetical protein PC111_g22740 [Phytophthora cactorum]KAG2803813.1 hypothetical protein PC112_g18995 [Phytophthora cactorum]KAG2850195.1 hypothetical protein PC113_g16992 [Phytophthora cactorum]KAG2883583.1 hypothetical protein PC114_g20517 [Phytophthora cactorum]